MNTDEYRETKIKLGKVISQSWSDEAYKARLIESPVETLKEAGIDVPVGEKIRVVEQSANDETNDEKTDTLISKEGDHFVLTLPLPPSDSDLEIGDEQLEAVTGGDFCCAGCSRWW